MARTGYHHGDLRAALIAAGLEMVAKHGIAALSVADAAKRTGVSAAAPYRHFPNRRAFLAAVATAAAREFDGEVRSAIPPRNSGDAATWAIEAMAATAGAYVRFVARTRIGWDIIYGSDMDQGEGVDEERLDVARSLNDAFLEPALAVTGGDVRGALHLLEHEVAAAHGYSSLFVAGLFDRKYPEIDRAATQAAAITRTLATAARRGEATP